MKTTFKKQIAVLFGAIAMIGYLSVRYFPQEEAVSTPVISTKDETKHMQIYMMDRDQTLVPLSIGVSEEMSEEDKLSLMVSYMSGKQEIKGFSPLFDKECVLQSASIKNGMVSLYFDDSLKNYKKEHELRVLEAITWGATQFHDIEQVKLFMNEKLLTTMPNAQTPIPDILNRSIGINHFETSTTSLHDSTSLTVFCTKSIEGNAYMVPQSRRVADVQGDVLKTNVEAILSDVSASSNLSQPLYADDIQVDSFDVYDGSLIVNLNNNILASNRSVKQDVYNALVLSLAALPGIEKVEVRVDGVTVSPKDQREDMVSVYALTYNEVKY